MLEERNEARVNPTDHLANERTFLAWIRTALAIMAFGFVVVKFNLFIKQLSILFINKPIVVPSKSYSGLIGVGLVAMGALICFLSFLQYKKTEGQLNRKKYSSKSPLVFWLTVTLLVSGILIVIYLFPNI